MFITRPVCARCGEPFQVPMEDDQVCAACLAQPPAFERARAAVLYGEDVRAIVLGLKRQGRRDGLSLMAEWMFRAGEDLIADADILIPTPLHFTRLVQRGFNQSVWLAAALSRRCGKPLGHGLLHRRRATPSQGGLTAAGRRRNVQGAFATPRPAAGRLAGKRVLLIDDVMTTGSTADACARALRRGGAAAVDVLTFARVEGPRTLTI